MAPENYQIARQFSLLAKLMEIHGENSFKAKSYSSAAFTIDKLPMQLAGLPLAKIAAIKGIGDSTAKKVMEIIEQGSLPALEALLKKTPPGVLEMMSIKGLGPKKIATIWKEMEIETPGELLYACTENRLARFKGFGEKSQQTISDAIEFYMKSQGNHLFAAIESYASELNKILHKALPKFRFELTGAIRRQLETVTRIEWVTTAPVQELTAFFAAHNFTEEEVLATEASFRTPENVLITFYSRTDALFAETLFETSSSPEFITEWNRRFPKQPSVFASEEDIFSSRKLNSIPPCLREKPQIIDKARTESFNNLLQPSDIRAIIHSHSTWSDGSQTIKEMAEACIKRGFEYLVISDHSRSAAYANGLTVERVLEQQREIDELNNKLAPFRIFSGIESDILGDGALDYPDNILATFDVVVASVHSNLKMPQEKAMMRLLKAISNPYTTILGHATGRLLLSRPGYPIDHKEIIDACAAHNVIIEINANPRRLDMDWRWIDYALEKGVLVSVDPDAHEIDEFDNCRYGVLAAQKAGVTAANNVSSFSLEKFSSLIASKTASRK